MRGFLSNSGQVCLAGTRILVERRTCEAFTKTLVQGMSALSAGSGDNEIAPMTTRAQYETVQQYYSLAKAEGAVAAVGGKLPDGRTLGDGWFVAPTLYVGVSRDMRIAREEIFGPVSQRQSIAICSNYRPYCPRPSIGAYWRSILSAASNR